MDSILDIGLLLGSMRVPINKKKVYKALYSYLFGNRTKEEILSRLLTIKGGNGLCTVKWNGEMMAVKCETCQSDPTAAICLDCFFDSDHSGHDYRLTPTYGGCCDCGDSGAWSPDGTCIRHCRPVRDEARELDCYSHEFLDRLQDLLSQAVVYLKSQFRFLHKEKKAILAFLIEFLSDLLMMDAGFRCIFSNLLSETDLNEWITKHQFLPPQVQKSMNSLWLTMLTLPSFKLRFSKIYHQVYIITYLPSRSSKEWCISNLSVQLFTYPDIALNLCCRGFLDSLLLPFLDPAYLSTELGILFFERFNQASLEMYTRSIADTGYILGHKEIWDLFLSETNMVRPLFVAMKNMNFMNAMEFVSTHVLYEITGFRVSFSIETSWQKATAQWVEYIKHCKIQQKLPFIKALNEYMAENLELPKQLSMCNKFYRSFHIPIIRFYASTISIEWLQSLAVLKLKSARCGDANSNCSSIDSCGYGQILDNKYGYSGLCNEDEASLLELFNVYDANVVTFCLQCVLSALCFSQEIHQNLWVYHGEEMHIQYEIYEECGLFSADVAALQKFIILLSIMKMDGHSLAFMARQILNVQTTAEIVDSDYKFLLDFLDIEKALLSYPDPFKVDCSDPVLGARPPGSLKFKFQTFVYILNLALYGAGKLEPCPSLLKGISNKQAYIDRVSRLAKMDIANIVAGGVLRYSELLNLVNRKWKHLPNLVNLIDQLCTVKESEINLNVYVRMKPECLELVDVLWNLYKPMQIKSMLEDTKRRDIGFLGPPRSYFGFEYRGVQRLVIEMFGASRLVHLALAILQLVVLDHVELYHVNIADESTSLSHPSTQSIISNVAHHKQQQQQGPETSLAGLALFMLKVLKLVFDEMPLKNVDSAKILVELFDRILCKLDDPVDVGAFKFEIIRLKKQYKLDCEIRETSTGLNINIKRLQQKYMERYKEKQRAHLKTLQLDKICKGDDAPLKSETGQKEESHESSPVPEIVETCIVCREDATSDGALSYMCALAGNNILARCVLTNGGTNARASFPRSCVMISSCGHIAHYACIARHLNNIHSNDALGHYRGEGSRDEFSCPICKGCCNFVLGDGTRQLPGKYRQRWKASTSTHWIATPTAGRFETLPEYTHYQRTLWDTDMHTSDTRIILDSLGIDTRCNECSKVESYSDDVPACNCPFASLQGTTIFQAFRYPEKCTVLHKIGKRLHEVIKQMRETVTSTPQLAVLLSNLYFTNELVPKAVATHYCRALFGPTRAFLGVQNWRHANVVHTDSLIWLLYTELTSLCTSRKHQLTSQLNFASALVHWVGTRGFEDAGEFCGRVWHEVPMVYPCIPSAEFLEPRLERMSFPNIYQKLDGYITSSEALVYWAAPNQLHELGTRLFNDGSLDESERHSLDGLADDDNDNNNELLKMRILEPCDTSKRTDDYPRIAKEFINKARNPHEYFKANEFSTYPNAWSIDVIREWFNFYARNYDGDAHSVAGIKEQMLYLLWVGCMQVAEHFIFKKIKERYIAWLKAQANPATKETLCRMAFVKYFFNKVLQPVISNGEFPVNVSNISWTDFKSHLGALSQGMCNNHFTNGVTREDFNTSVASRDLLELLDSKVLITDDLSTSHWDTIKALAIPIPACYMEEELESDCTILLGFLKEQIATLDNIRRLYSCANSVFYSDDDRLYNNLLKQIDHLSEERPCDSPSKIRKTKRCTQCSNRGSSNSPRFGITVDCNECASSGFRVFKSSINNDIQDQSEPFFDAKRALEAYQGMDFIYRLNLELTKSHLNKPMFHVFHSWVPNSIHLVDIVSKEFSSLLHKRELNVIECGSFGACTNKSPSEFFHETFMDIFEMICQDLQHQRLLDQDDVFDLVKEIWVEVAGSLKLYLDVVLLSCQLWSKYKASQGLLINAIPFTNSPLDFHSTFDYICQHLHLGRLLDKHLFIRITRRLFDPCISMHMRLQVNLGVETDAPIVCGYELPRVDLPVDPWELVRNVSKRSCPNCGNRPKDPYICLSCNGVFCSSGNCVAPASNRIENFRAMLRVPADTYMQSDLCQTLHSLVIHARNCGGGQGIFVKPYTSQTVYLDQRRMGKGPHLYADSKGIDSLSKRHGRLQLANSRMKTLMDYYSQGRLAQAIINTIKPNA